MGRASLSLCLIAKNEGAMLADCLRSVQGVVNQIVVCDTGSDDRTVQIAQQFGATLCHSKWVEDFAAARNAALAQATGDYVLLLDADERLSRSAATAIKDAMMDSGWDVGLIDLVNASRLDAPEAEVLSGDASLGPGVPLPRLFRRTPDLRWEGVVHESPKTWMQVENRVARMIQGAIIHLGCVPELRESLKKSERNLDLLQRRVKAEPENSVVWGYLARELLQASRRAEAETAILTGYEALRRQKARGERPAIVALVTLTLQLHLEKGDFHQMVAVADEALGWSDPHPNLLLLKGVALSTLAQTEGSVQRLAEAGRCFSGCLSWSRPLTQAALPGACSWAAARRLAEVRLAQGRLNEVEPLLCRALSEKPDAFGALLARVELQWRRGDFAQALSALEPLLSSEKPDAWVLSAALLSQLAGPRDMIAMVQRAMELVPNGFESPHRFGLLEQVLLEAKLYTGQAEAGPGLAGYLGAILSKGVGQGPKPSLEWMDHLLENLIKAGRADDLKALLTAQAQATLPGVGEAVVAFIGRRRSG